MKLTTTLYREMEIDITLSYDRRTKTFQIEDSVCEGRPVQLRPDEERQALLDAQEDLEPSSEPDDAQDSRR